MSEGNRVISGLYKGTISGYNFEARLDVDGTNPQMECTVFLINIGSSGVYYIAHMGTFGANKWEGNIWYTQNSALRIGDSRPNKIAIEYIANNSGKSLKFTYKKDATSLWSGTIPKISDYFRETQLELDYEQGLERTLTYDTNLFNRPAGVDAEELTIEKVYGRAGIEITRSSAVNAVPAGSGADSKWSNQELHDAMIANWSRSEGDPWAMWVFFAKEGVSRPGFTLFGIMFDTIGAHERSGTAIFSEGIANYYGGNNRNFKRDNFHTIIHEMGHAFNLLHSWEKTFGSRWDNSVVNEPGAASFMNYPQNYPGGTNAFWGDFAFRFSDQELLFLRHAPEAYVNMGGSDFAVDNALTAPSMELLQELSQQDRGSATLQLDLRVNKQRPVFEFMEPVVLELKLKNISNQPREVDKTILEDIGHMTISITRNQSETKQYRSYSQLCFAEEKMTLQPGESLYSNLFLSAGSLGWYIADPGMYEITVAVSVEKEDSEDKEIVSASFSLIVLRPSLERKREEEKLAQDVFNDDVGRIMAFQGSNILGSGNDVLWELTDRFPQANAVTHAEVALATPKLKNSKMIEFSDGKPQVKVQYAKLEEASQKLQKVLVDKGTEAANTLGNIGFKQISDTLSQELADQGAEETAVAVEENVLKVMDKRGVKLPKKVKEDIESKVKSFKDKKGKKSK